MEFVTFNQIFSTLFGLLWVLPQTPPRALPCMDPWWRNPLSPPKQIPGYAHICYGKTKQLAKSLTRF